MPIAGGAENATKDGLIIRFFMHPVKDRKKSIEAGYPVFNDVEHIEAKVLGSNSTVAVYEVQEKHRQKWPKHYEAFKKGIEYIEEGFRIDEWSAMQPALVATLKASGIHTVEQFVKISENQAKYLGCLSLRDQAAKMLAAKDVQGTQVAELLEANRKLMERLDALEAKPKKAKKRTLTAAQKKKMADGRAAAAAKKKAAAEE